MNFFGKISEVLGVITAKRILKTFVLLFVVLALASQYFALFVLTWAEIVAFVLIILGVLLFVCFNNSSLESPSTKKVSLKDIAKVLIFILFILAIASQYFNLLTLSWTQVIIYTVVISAVILFFAPKSRSLEKTAIKNILSEFNLFSAKVEMLKVDDVAEDAKEFYNEAVKAKNKLKEAPIPTEENLPSSDPRFKLYNDFMFATEDFYKFMSEYLAVDVEKIRKNINYIGIVDDNRKNTFIQTFCDDIDKINKEIASVQSGDFAQNELSYSDYYNYKLVNLYEKVFELYDIAKNLEMFIVNKNMQTKRV